MKKRCRTLMVGMALVTGLTALGGTPAGADEHGDADQVELGASLSGLNEVAAGDADGTGDAEVKVEGTEVCWEIEVANIATVVAAHIHVGAIGANGGVVVNFLGQLEGCTTVSPVLATALRDTPQNYYVNVHTADFPGGAVRGQLRNENHEAAEVEFETRLSGAAERPGPGDPDGNGKFRAELEGTLLCWKFQENNVDPITARHIHFAPATAPGPVVVPFGAIARGCRDITATLAAAIVANPARYYVNSHNPAFPAGAVRGQLG